MKKYVVRKNGKIIKEFHFYNDEDEIKALEKCADYYMIVKETLFSLYLHDSITFETYASYDWGLENE